MSYLRGILCRKKFPICSSTDLTQKAKFERLLALVTACFNAVAIFTLLEADTNLVDWAKWE